MSINVGEESQEIHFEYYESGVWEREIQVRERDVLWKRFEDPRHVG